MKFTINQAVFNAAVKKAAGAIGTQDLKPELKNFKMEAVMHEGKHLLKIMATSQHLASIATTNLVVIEEQGSVTMPAKKILEYTSIADEVDIHVKHLENFRVQLSYGSNNTEFQGLDPDQWPTIPLWIPEGASELEKEPFQKALKRVSPTISDDDTKVTLTNVEVDGEFVKSSDGHRISMVKLVTPLRDFKISKATVPELIKVLDVSGSTNIFVNQTKEFQLFSMGGDVFAARHNISPFPDLVNKFLIPGRRDCIRELKIERSTMLRVVERVAITSDDEKSEITMLFSNNKITFKSKERDGHNSEESVNCFWREDEKSPTLPKIFNFSYIMDFLKALKKKEVSLMFGNDTITKRFPIFSEEEDFIGGVLQRKPPQEKTAITAPTPSMSAESQFTRENRIKAEKASEAPPVEAKEALVVNEATVISTAKETVVVNK